jgi:hypothetical protein
MKKLNFLIFFLVIHIAISFSQNEKIENIIIVTTDGFRWQEVFKGMDSVIANNPKFNQNDSAAIFKKYWADTEQNRRSKLMPFLWNTIAVKGQVYGNRALGNNVNVANPYWFSYPGYNEILCGYVDTAINSNGYKANPNTNLLEFINKQKGFEGKVAAFGAWDAFDRILNEKRSGFPVICGNDSCGGKTPDAEQTIINKLKKDAYNPFGSSEKLDVFTHYAAMDYLQKNKPRVEYISYGETDEWAHEGHYEDYLDAVNKVDKWLNDIWTYLQSSPIYKDKTLLLVTVDHGRGDIDKSKWTSHNSKIPGSDQIWFAVMGPQILAKGEISSKGQIYQKQFAQTIAQLLNLNFSCEHIVGDGFKEVLVK